ncbi:MAG: GNAT family N-acetyltransferase [Methylophilaceae bacterium]|nr:GNAT family N-acetyltransferase [Methylophilaceae bacterium]
MNKDQTLLAAKLEAIQAADFAMVAQLGESIWREHYASIISQAQIDYMLNNRYSAENLRKYVDANDRWLDILKLTDQAIGYCSYALTAEPASMKLEQLYLLAEFRGQGLGGLMLSHVEQQARWQGWHSLILQVNKGNTKPIAIYRKAGFLVREEAVFDIGHGFFMDDFVMEKRL